MKFFSVFAIFVTAAALQAQSRVEVQGDYVVFTYINPDCEQAFVGGNFNAWEYEKSPMVKQPDGTWKYRLRKQGLNAVEFKFVHELEWDQDSYLAAPGWREDGFGGRNGVIILANEGPPPPPERNQRIRDNSDVRDFFLPGISASLAQPFQGGKLYTGLNFHYTLLTGILSEGRYSFGGYYAHYLEIGYYKEMDSALNDDIFFILNYGITVSFEKMHGHPRNFLVPYFGTRLGAIVFRGSSPGLLVEPILGLVFFYTTHAILKYDASLLLSSVNLSSTIGLRHSLALSINF